MRGDLYQRQFFAKRKDTLRGKLVRLCLDENKVTMYLTLGVGREISERPTIGMYNKTGALRSQKDDKDGYRMKRRRTRLKHIA